MTAALPPRDEPPMRAAWRLARALSDGDKPCNLMPTSPDRVPRLDGWPGWALPHSPRLEAEALIRWRAIELRDLDRGRESLAWALLPGSVRVVVIDSDAAEWTERWLERQPTPLVVRSPTRGRAHLYYRWPDSVDLGSRDGVAGAGTYDLKARARSIHAPGSLHWRRAGRYVCSLPEAEQVPGLRERLPVLDLAFVEEDARLRPGARDEWRCDLGEERWDDTGEGARRWAAYLRGVPPATSGARQSTLIRLARKAGDLGLPEPSARAGLLEWAASCQPPLDRDEALGALRRAYLTRRSPVGSDLAPDAGGVIVDL